MLYEDLRVLKEKSNLTLAEISEKSGIPQSTITKMFNGSTADPLFSSVAAVVSVLGGSLDQLAGIDPPGAPPSDERLIRLYREIISYKNRWLRICAAALAVLVTIIIILYIL